MEQSVPLCHAKFTQKPLLECIQLCQNCIARMVDCGSAVLDVREQLAFIKVDQLAVREKSRCSDYGCDLPSSITDKLCYRVFHLQRIDKGYSEQSKVWALASVQC